MTTTSSPLRIAVPNKGALSQACVEILRECGYRQRDDSKKLTLIDTENDVVTLSGAVRSRKEKLLAEMIARNTDGIARVDNRLEIDQRS